MTRFLVCLVLSLYEENHKYRTLRENLVLMCMSVLFFCLSCLLQSIGL
jgi:hypothetical protein